MTIYYLIRSQADGRYLVAHPDKPQGETSGYLLVFREHFDALSYLNTHGGIHVAAKLAVESVPVSQLEGLLKRWGFTGMGIVQDPLLPKIEFLSHV